MHMYFKVHCTSLFHENLFVVQWMFWYINF